MNVDCKRLGKKIGFIYRFSYLFLGLEKRIIRSRAYFSF